MNLVNVSEGTSLALHGLALIAMNKPKRMTVTLLAKELSASKTHLAKVFQKLVKAGFVNSARGPAGGFELNVNDVTFLEIYEAIEGKINMGTCPFGKINCNFTTCVFATELNRISNDIYETFQKIKLSDFTKES